MTPMQRRDTLLLATLPHVPFDGWTERAMRAGAESAGLDAAAIRRAFPGGVAEMVEYFIEYADRRMVEELERRGLPSLRLRDRIATAVRVRLEQSVPYREAIRRAIAFLALPQYAGIAVRRTYRTVDLMWWAAGDTATDFSFYTKRATLAAVYSSTLLYWLDDESAGFSDTWAFLERRIDDVMRIGKARARIEKSLDRLPNPFRLFRPARGARP